MSMDPEERARKVREVQNEYDENTTIGIVREYLKYEHARDAGIQKQYDSEPLREMVDIYYDALRELLIDRFGDAQTLDRLMQRARRHLLEPHHYANTIP